MVEVFGGIPPNFIQVGGLRIQDAGGRLEVVLRILSLSSESPWAAAKAGQLAPLVEKYQKLIQTHSALHNSSTISQSVRRDNGNTLA